MIKIILALLTTFILACSGSGNPNPVAPANDSDNQNPVTPSINPFVGSWSVTELEIIAAEGDTMSQSSPNVSGSAVFTSGTVILEVDLFGLPTVRESGDYTFDNSTITLTLESSGETKTWDYFVADNTLTLTGERNSGGEEVGVRITASKLHGYSGCSYVNRKTFW